MRHATGVLPPVWLMALTLLAPVIGTHRSVANPRARWDPCWAQRPPTSAGPTGSLRCAAGECGGMQAGCWRHLPRHELLQRQRRQHSRPAPACRFADGLIPA